MFDEKLTKIANTLVTYCREGKEAQGLNELYAKDAVSVEAVDFSGQGRESKGVDAIKGKHEWWNNAFDVHDASVDGPYIHGDDRFSVIFAIDATSNETKERSKMREVGVYTVNNGKIAREEFYYSV